MNPDILILIVSSLPYLSMGVLFYFVAVRKNAFEERVAHYIPSLSCFGEGAQSLYGKSR